MEQDVENEYRTVCSTCLSSDRDLFALSNVNVPQAFQIFKLLMYDFAGDRLGEMAEISHLICWECLALMKRFHKFKWQVHNAQEHIRVLALSQESFPQTMDHTYMSQSLSTLAVETKSDYDKIYFDYTIPDCHFIVSDGMDVKSEQFVTLKDTIGMDVEEHILEVPEIVLSGNSQVFSHVVLGADTLVSSTEAYGHVKSEQMPSLTITPMTSANLEAGTVILSQQPCKTESEPKPGYTTEYMSEDDMLSSREEAKKKVSYASSVYKCELCAIGFYTQQQVEQHFESQHRPKPGLVACKLCFRYINESALGTHVRQHYMRYRCKMCSHTEYSEQLMQIHAKAHLAKSVPNAVIKIEGSDDKKQKIIALRNERRRLRDASDPVQLPEAEFIENFRLSKAGYRRVLDMIRPYLPVTQRTTAVRVELKVLAALYFFANGTHQRKLGASFLWNMSQASFSKCLHDVTDALNDKDVLLRHIRFPNSKQRREIVMKGFMDKFRFPGVIGCIDGTQVNIVRPVQDVYLNRQKKHSLNVLIISDADLNILHVDASFGGSSDDSYVWNHCQLRSYLEKLERDSEQCWLLGDSDYPQNPWLMTPISKTQGSHEEYYNVRHSAVRNTVQRCIGILKTRWRCLLLIRGLYYEPTTAGRIVNACVVLNNIANSLNLPTPLPENDDDYHQSEESSEVVLDETRDALVRKLWNDRF